MQEIIVDSDVQTSPAKLTGTTDKQIIVRIGQKRLLLACDDGMREGLEKVIPKKLKITFSSNKLISFEDIPE